MLIFTLTFVMGMLLAATVGTKGGFRLFWLITTLGFVAICVLLKLVPAITALFAFLFAILFILLYAIVESKDQWRLFFTATSIVYGIFLALLTFFHVLAEAAKVAING